MIVWNSDEEIKITSSIMPNCAVLVPLPNMSKSEKKELLKKPYINKKDVIFEIEYENEQYKLHFENGYTWDGASIPFGFRWLIGAKGSPQFLIPSMVHDRLCENHSFIKNNRYLSSLIFRKLLEANGIGVFRAMTMFHSVDNFQKVFGGWR